MNKDWKETKRVIAEIFWFVDIIKKYKPKARLRDINSTLLRIFPSEERLIVNLAISEKRRINNH